MKIFKPTNENEFNYIHDIFYMNKLQNSCNNKKERLQIVFNENKIKIYCYTPIYSKIRTLIILSLIIARAIIAHLIVVRNLLMILMT